MISWQIVNPDGRLHEYKAQVAGIDFYIWQEIRQRPFGISASRRLPNGTSEQLTRSSDMIEWYDTLEECKARAERILRDHQVRAH